jgi:hypothetical protein
MQVGFYRSIYPSLTLCIRVQAVYKHSKSWRVKLDFWNKDTGAYFGLLYNKKWHRIYFQDEQLWEKFNPPWNKGIYSIS